MFLIYEKVFIVGGKIPKLAGIVLVVVLIAVSVFFLCKNGPVKSSLKISYSLPNSQNKVTGFAVENATGEVKNLVLEDGAKIDYGSQAIDLSGVDLESAVKITNTSVYVDSKSAPELNKPARLTFYNVTISDPVILEDGKKCPNNVCSNIVFENEVLSFDVAHFTNFTYNANTNLTIWDETDSGRPYEGQLKYVNDVVLFFANYTNEAGNALTPTGNAGKCNISFAGSANNAMAYDGTKHVYTYSKSFYPKGDWKYNVSCVATGHTLLNVSDNATIKNKITCDARPDADTCTIINSYPILKETVINSADIGAKNLVIDSGGKIYSSPGNINLTINLTGNLTINNGGLINTSAAYTGNVLDPGHSGDIKIFANVIKVSGSILSEGSYGWGGHYYQQCGQDYYAYHGGYAGKIILNASEVYIYGSGSLRSMGNDAPSSSNPSWYDAGHGNEININATKTYIYAGALLSTVGGNNVNYDGSGCGMAEGGLGGNIRINSNSVNIDSASINLSGGISHYGAPGYGGILNITANTILYKGSTTATGQSSYYDGQIHFNFNNNMTRLSGYSYSPVAWIENSNHCAYSSGTFFNTSLVDNTNWIIDNYNCHLSGSHTLNNIVMKNSGNVTGSGLSLKVNNNFNSSNSAYITGLNLLNISKNATIISGTLGLGNAANLQVADVLKVSSGATLQGFKSLDPDMINISGNLVVSVNNANISGKNLIVGSTGQIYSSPISYSFKINVSENLTVKSGGKIHTYNLTWAVDMPVNTARSAGSMTILAKNINISGEIDSLGPGFTKSISDASRDYCADNVSKAGNIQINAANNIYLNGIIQAVGYSRLSGCYWVCGGGGGSIGLHANKNIIIYPNSKINSTGGIGTHTACYSYGNAGGAGGNISLSAKNISAKSLLKINARGGDAAEGWPIGGNGGSVKINATGSILNISTGIIDTRAGTVVGTQGYSGNVFLISPKTILSIINITTTGYNSSYDGNIKFTRLCGWNRGTYAPSANYNIINGYGDSDHDAIYDDSLVTVCGIYKDNCPNNFNPGQEDSNHNGFGDVCDATIYYTVQNQNTSQDSNNLVDIDNQPTAIWALYKTGVGMPIPANVFFNFYREGILIAGLSCFGNTNCTYNTTQSIGTHNITIEANSTIYPYTSVSFNFTVTNILVSRKLSGATNYLFNGYNTTRNLILSISGNMSYIHNNKRLDQNQQYELWIDGVKNASSVTMANGVYQTNLNVGNILGNHIAKINISQATGLYGETSVLYTVWMGTGLTNYLVQKQPGATDNQVDIDDKNVSINITYINDTSGPIPGTINITVNNVLKSCPPAKSCGQLFSLGTGKNIPALGTYTVYFTARNNSAYYRPQTTTAGQYQIRVRNITITETITPDHAQPGQLITVSGRAFYADNNENVTNKYLSIYVNGTFNKSVQTNTVGVYTHTFHAYPVQDAGIYNVSVNYTDTNGIGGKSVKLFGIFTPTKVSVINWTYNKTTAVFNISANYSRADTNQPISGNWNVILKNTKIPSINATKQCYGKNICTLSFKLGTGAGVDLRGGNTTIIVSAKNESAYFNSSSYSFLKYLEEKNTTVKLWVQSRVVTDKVSAPYSLNITAVLNNTGFGTAYNPIIYVTYFDSGFSSPNSILPCTANLTPSDLGGNICRLNFTINISAATGEGNYIIYWKANFTNNDKSTKLSSPATKSTINISGIATVALETPFKRTISHRTTAYFVTEINNTGTTTARHVNVTFSNRGLPQSWVNWTWYNFGRNHDSNGLLDLICDQITINGGGTSYCTADEWGKAYEPLNITVSVPAGTSPGNYIGILNFSYCFGPSCSQKHYREMLLNISVPLDNSWYQYPKISYKTVGLNIPGTIETIFVNNTGNVNENFTIAYGKNLTQSYPKFAPEDNPSTIFAPKNSLVSFSLVHGAFTTAKNYVLEVNITNATANPQLNTTLIYLTVVNVPPSITITKVSENPVDVNRQINITANITNDDNSPQNTVKAWGVFNHSSGISYKTPVQSFTVSPGNYITKTFSYSPQLNGTYKVTIFANDTGNRIGNTSVFFSTWGYTTLNITRNMSAVKIYNVTQADSKKFSFNLTVKNIGHARAYITNLTAFVPSGWLATITRIGTIVINQIKSAVINITVPATTKPGLYYVYPKAVWRQANGTIVGNLGESINVNVTSTQRLSLGNYLNSTSVDHGTTKKTNFTLNSIGNTNLTDAHITCSGVECGTFGIILSPSYIANIAGGNYKRINLTISVPRGQAWLAGGYFVTIGASNAYDSKSYSLNIIVPKDETYASKSNITINTVSKYKSVYYYRINNTGNVNESLVFNLTGAQVTPIINLLKNGTLITAQQHYDLGLNYTAPDISGTNVRNGNLTIRGPVNKIIPIIFNTYGVVLGVKNISKTSNIIAGNKLVFRFNISLAGTPLMANVSYKIYISGNKATINYKRISNNDTILNFTAPAARDGRRNNLTLETTYNSNIGVLVFNTTLVNALLYRDVTPPSVIDEYSPSVELGNNITMEINTTDNINISRAIAVVNGITYALATTNGYTYKYTFATPAKGDYDITYKINDTTNNLRTYSEYFEVFEYKHLYGVVNDYKNVSTIFKFYRPNSTQLLYNYTTNHIYNLTVHKRNYDIIIAFTNSTLTLRGVNATILPDDFLKMGKVPSTIRVTPSVKTLNGIGGSINLSNINGLLMFEFNPNDIADLNRLGIWKCSSWNMASESCSSSWTKITSTVINNHIYAILTSLSAYIFGQDNSVAATTVTNVGGGGGGGGPSISQIAQLVNESKQILQEIKKQAIRGLSVDTTDVSVELYPGESASTIIKLVNTRNETVTAHIKVSGDAANYTTVSPESVVLAKGEEAGFDVEINIPKTELESGMKYGRIILSAGEEETDIPVKIRLLAPVGMEPKITVEPLSTNVVPGENLKVQFEITHPIEIPRLYNVSLELVNTQFGAVISEISQKYAIGKTTVDSLTLNVPQNAALGEYYVKGTLYYNESGVIKSVTDAKPVSIVKPLTERIKTFAFTKVAFLTVWQIVLIIICLGVIASAVQEYRVVMKKKKKYQFIVDYETLPEPGPRSACVGVVAETNKRAFIDIDKLTMHTIVAGATGGGKTIAAQDIVEECLLKNISVVVFDPTAQWTGFLRKCDDKKMMRLYSKFGLSPKAARAFNGSIHEVTNPREVLDLKKFMKPGEINIIAINKLEPEEIDIFVANTVREIFRMNLPESPDLKTLIVYDEVHRLLPKYGGSGEGIIQLERGCREFRKWGVGVLLISQVLSDFVGEIKANINTEMQMRTRHEGDLTRISRKYGEYILQNLVRAGVGTGMIENAEWNKGHPYLVTFRPILHATKRLTDDELEKYNKYDNIVEDIRNEIEQLKDSNVDVYDLEIELNLALGKLKSGNFEMVEIYLDGIKPRIQKHWQALGKTPKKREIKLVPEEEIKKEIEEAKKAREAYLTRLRKVPEVELGQALREVVGESTKKPAEADKKPAEKGEVSIRDLVNHYNGLRKKVLEINDKIKLRDAATKLTKTAEDVKKAMQTNNRDDIVRLKKDLEEIEKGL